MSLTLALVSSLAAAPVPAARAEVARRPDPHGAEWQRFRQRDFAKPDAFLWPGCMWVWNDELAEPVLRAQLADMAARGALTVTPLPEPKEFRPANMPTLMAPDYLSPEFLERFRFMAEEARRLGMRIWLYDEGGWPSGSACGRVVQARPELARQSLARQESAPKPGETVTVSADALAGFLYRGTERVRRLAPGESVKVDFEDARLLLFQAQRGGRYPDLLNPEATREFLRLTHEAHRTVSGHLFGTTIPVAFTDEPAVANPPWTAGLAESFAQQKGYDLLDRLPSLFEGDSRQDMQARVDFFDWWTARFAEAYFGQIQEWCRRNGILSGGHLGGEDETLGPRRHGFGHVLRMLRRLDVPGVDVIWRQVWPGKDNHYFPKYAATVAHQEDRRWAMSESFAVYGSGITPAQMKWLVDYQYVRGINLLTAIGYPLSTRDWLMGGERPNFGPTNPLWRHLAPFHAYVARLGYLLSLGRPDVRTAVYYPVRDLWAGGPDLDAVARGSDQVAQRLLDAQRDYDFVDDDVLGRPTTRVHDGKLHVGPMAYDTVVISRTAWMGEGARRRLAELSASGGRVLWVDGAPGVTAVPGSTPATVEELAGRLTPLVQVDPACPRLRVMRRMLPGGAL